MARPPHRSKPDHLRVADEENGRSEPPPRPSRRRTFEERLDAMDERLERIDQRTAWLEAVVPSRGEKRTIGGVLLLLVVLMIVRYFAQLTGIKLPEQMP